MSALDQRKSAPRGSPQLDLDAAIVDVVSRGAVKIPPYPAVAMKVEHLVRKGDFGLGDLTRLVASDQALAADALRCANSAFYNRGTPIASLNAAIGRIGAKEVARLALASGLGTYARKPGPLAVLKRRVWLDALASAALSQELARRRAVAPEDAFACGLLHDFGKMIAIACIEEILESRGEAPRPMEAWMEVVDRYHVELGIALAAKWDLPQLVADVISLHHAEDPSGAAEPRVLEIVLATDEVVKLLENRIWLTPEDLGVVSALTAPECELMSRVLDRLPAFIASFEDVSQVRPRERSLVEARPAAEVMAGPTPVAFPVTVMLGKEKRVYQATGISARNLMITGPVPLPENVLVEVVLGAATPLSCWVTAKLSWVEAGVQTTLLQPFALDEPARQAWRRLVQQVPPEA